MALGTAAGATGMGSVAIGRQSAATNDASLALGTASSSQGTGSVAVGHSSHAVGDRAIAIGTTSGNKGAVNSTKGTPYDEDHNTEAIGDRSIAFGIQAETTEMPPIPMRLVIRQRLMAARLSALGIKQQLITEAYHLQRTIIPLPLVPIRLLKALITSRKGTP